VPSLSAKRSRATWNAPRNEVTSNKRLVASRHIASTPIPAFGAGYAVIPVDLDDPMPMRAAGIEESGTDPIMARDKSRWRGELRRLRSGADLATLA